MPRLGLAINQEFDTRARVGKPDKFGRRVRHVPGVETPARDHDSIFVNPFVVKLALWLAVIAFLAMSAAMWRLFSFPH